MVLGFFLFVFPTKKVRFAVLKVLQELYAKLGEEFLVLLPETIPFLAELMEGIADIVFLLSHASTQSFGS